MRFVAFVALLLLLATVSGGAEAARVRVRAGAVLEARAVPRSGGTELRGILKDDTGRPIGQARVQIALAGGRSLPPPESCGRLPAAFSIGTGQVVDTDGAGAFCVRMASPVTGKLRLRFEGDRFYDKVETELEVDATRRALALRFSPEPRFLPLERAHHAISVQTTLEPPDLESAPESVLLKLSLRPRDGQERSLAEATVSAGEAASFTINTTDLGEPGPATLVVSYPGSETIAPAQRTTVVQRTARVTLALAGTLAAADPSEGLEIPVAVGSALGAVPAGSVETVVGGESVGTAPVRSGASLVVAVFDAPHSSTVPVTVRYLPEAPWWIPGDPLTVPAAIAPPSPWRRLPWILAALGIAVWVVRGWRRPARTDKKVDERERVPTGRASVDVIERGPARGGWRGRVLDAHDGSPVAGARVAITIPAFGGGGRAATTTTDEDGQFELPHVEGANAEGAQIEATARWHARLARPLPIPGHVAIQLVSRRRALLERLVEWSRRRGRPWSDVGEPTPGHIAKIAKDRRARDVEGWAQAVERAAYGPEPPDETAESAVRDREPDWRR
jgi:hypothetical protein